MGSIASQITSLAIVYSSVYSGIDQRKHQSSASLAYVWGIHRRPVNSPHKGPVTQKMIPFDDVIMQNAHRVKLRMYCPRILCVVSAYNHDDVIEWKHSPRYWPFVRGIHWSPVDSPYKDQWRGALMLSLIWTNSLANNRGVGDLRHNRTNYEVTAMTYS